MPMSQSTPAPLTPPINDAFDVISGYIEDGLAQTNVLSEDKLRSRIDPEVDALVDSIIDRWANS